MNRAFKSLWAVACLGLCLSAGLALNGCKDDDDHGTHPQPPAADTQGQNNPTATPTAPPNDSGNASAASTGNGSASSDKLVPVTIELPTPMFVGTPPVTKDMKIKVDTKHPESKREPLMAPPDVKVVSRGAKVTSSDDMPMIGELSFVTDGNKEANEGAYVELAPGKQWIQVELGQPYEIWGIVIWHYHATQRVYRDVIVQIADDPDMTTNVRTLFNNDYDNSSGMGVGEDYEYFDEHVGKLIRVNAQVARYIRCYSNGNTENDQNHYIEIEVWGRPVKK